MLRKCSQAVAILMTLCFVFFSRGMAQEAYYLAIHGEGTACILIPEGGKKEAGKSEKGKTAYIIDGGKAETGLSTARMDDKPVVQALWDRGIRHLVMVCSHPHKDHMGGLEEMIRKDNDFLRFTSYVFVDSGYDKIEGKKSLYRTFTEAHGNQTKKALYLPAEQGDKIVNVFKSKLSQTDLKGVFPGKLDGDASLRVAMLEYEPQGKGAHDHALIVEHTLRKDDETIRIVNFDDAETELLHEWVKQRAEEWK